LPVGQLKLNGRFFPNIAPTRGHSGLGIFYGVRQKLGSRPFRREPLRVRLYKEYCALRSSLEQREPTVDLNLNGAIVLVAVGSKRPDVAR
jgi:hypothetical protein